MSDELFAARMEEEMQRLVAAALHEDLGETGDITSLAIVDENDRLQAAIIVKDSGVIAGIGAAARVFKTVDPETVFTALSQDGDSVDNGTVIATVEGVARALLIAERSALNILQHLSGIATEARRYAEAVEDYDTVVLDTRKTLPGLRYLEKYAARVGGVINHRMGLFDQILIKDNHIRIAGGVVEAVNRARKAMPNRLVEVEAETIEQVEQALAAGADTILLDNMDTELLAEAVRLIAKRATTEASGGIKLSNIAAVAATGVDRISVGAITYAARPLDISMEVI